jgi:hypothetical protein
MLSISFSLALLVKLEALKFVDMFLIVSRVTTLLVSGTVMYATSFCDIAVSNNGSSLDEHAYNRRHVIKKIIFFMIVIC